ncbi:hypothetical protein [Pseudosulfitobacter pseudonitzschiae]|uniref:hypothetical protein n=1 Tax=Pseudosulfitobacter pseudonitzschiae TaxID=1402135 RepID=UPI001AF7DD9D|nr:hypothetical protein [Pseudosulfitobacter pseudonitzschiae]MBM1814917.1 hypothetical protein [Pseudosulfitobacter pseudonitzschiae]MBM1831911.1 hypothetical protein [Pseudosulfitobacter pseudonitzschiae]MBM1836776.1 hypothetical protein [Pseudosulfitobacter pseudonitzschiae]MBM1841623.1 hypothetical protein [Pseudosulfitobacter pseudonitzschiae]MBM1846490.1 hypothetical protein [Pseudosulfitobacter pseudonitzschiae]
MNINPIPNDHHRRVLLAPSSGRVPHATAIIGAWLALKQARGHTVDLDRIGTPHHLIATPQSELQADLDQRLPRIKDRVRELWEARMAHRPTGGDAA